MLEKIFNQAILPVMSWTELSLVTLGKELVFRQYASISALILIFGQRVVTIRRYCGKNILYNGQQDRTCIGSLPHFAQGCGVCVPESKV